MIFSTLLFALLAGSNAAPVNQTLSKRGPSYNWGFYFEGFERIGNTAGNPAYHVFPDGALTSLPNPDGGFEMYWSNCENYRTSGWGPNPEQQTAVNPWIPYPTIYFGGRTNQPGYANGGKWLMSVHKHPDGNPRHMVAFYHAEDGYWPYQGAGGPAWKSVGVAETWDNGYSWTDRGQILTVGGRPSDAEGIARGVYGGIGNHGCIWQNDRWACIFVSTPEHSMGIAVSWDPSGSPGSWKKWDGGGFNSPGLGGGYASLPGLPRGTNPTISWNSVLQKYIMAFGTWDNNIFIAASSDLVHWDGARFLVGPTYGLRAWYPSLIGGSGSYSSDGSIAFYYADGLSPGGDTRVLTKRTLKIQRFD